MYPTKIATEEMIVGMGIERSVREKTNLSRYMMRVVDIEEGMGGVKTVRRNLGVCRKEGARLWWAGV